MLCYPTYKLEKSPGPGTTGKKTFHVILAILRILLIVWDVQHHFHFKTWHAIQN